MQWIDSIFMPAPDATGHRVLLAGSVPPDDRLHRAIEAAGADVVGEAHVFDSGRLGPQCPVDAESPERALASHLLKVSIAPRAMIGRAERVVERAVAARANTVVIWLTREDEALAWQVPALRNALAAAGLPALVLAAADWRCDDQTLERVNVFLEEYGRAAT
jgi:hypothetical protein